MTSPSKAWLYKAGRGWLPADDIAKELHDHMGAGECAEFRIVRPRSVQWHRMFFALLREIGHNQDPVRDEEDILDEIKVLAGHYRTLIVRDPKSGEMFEVRSPKSIAFARMTADEWSALWPSLEQAISERFGDTYIANIGVGRAA